MAGRKDLTISLALIGLVLCGPTALAAYLLAAGEPPVITLAAVLPSPEPDPAPDGAARSPAATGFAGVLVTRGAVTVDWQGVAIPVENGSYAYVGGEQVEVAPDAMGVLRLDDGSAVYACAGSRTRLLQRADGSLRLEVLAGSARFVFPGGRAFAVDAGPAMVTPLADVPGDAGDVAGEIHVEPDRGSVVCALHRGISVGRGAKAVRAVEPGEVVTVAPAGESGEPGAGITSRPVPAPFAAAFARRSGATYDTGNMPYLCRCRDLERYADAAERTAPGAVPPSGDEAPGVPADAPPLLPPVAAGPALAVPGAPDPFDPNVLPPPAAGPASADLSVPPVLVPSGGSGGGTTTSAS